MGMLIIKSKNGDEMSIDMKSIECLAMVRAFNPEALHVITKTGLKVFLSNPKYQNSGNNVDVESLSGFVIYEADIIMINVSSIHKV